MMRSDDDDAIFLCVFALINYSPHVSLVFQLLQLPLVVSGFRFLIKKKQEQNTHCVFAQEQKQTRKNKY